MTRARAIRVVAPATDGIGIAQAIGMADGYGDRSRYVSLAGRYGLSTGLVASDVLLAAEPGVLLTAEAEMGSMLRRTLGPLHLDGRWTLDGAGLAGEGVYLDRAYSGTMTGMVTVRRAAIGLLAEEAQSIGCWRLHAQDCGVGVRLSGTGGASIDHLRIDSCGVGLEVLGDGVPGASPSAGGVMITDLRIEHTDTPILIDCAGMVAIGRGHIEGGPIIIRGGHVRIRDLRMVGMPSGGDPIIDIQDAASVVIDGLHVDTAGQASSWVQAPQALIDSGRVVVRDSWRPYGAQPPQRVPLIGAP